MQNGEIVDNDSNKKPIGVNGKRRTWKSPVSEVKSPRIEIVRGKSESSVNSLKLTKPRSTGLTTPPVTPRRLLCSDESKDKNLSVSVVKKGRSDSIDGIEKITGRVRKTRSEICSAIVKSSEFESGRLRKVNSLPVDKKTEDVEVPLRSDLGDEKKEEIVIEKSEMLDEVKEVGVCDENPVTVNSNVDEEIVNGDQKEEEEEEKEEEEEEEEKEEEEEVEAVKEEEEKKNVDVVKSFSQFHNMTAPSSSTVVKIPSPVIKKATSVYSESPKSTSRTERFAEEEENFTQSQSKLQSLVDLVMWKEVSRSALVFGFGTFLIISSSYAKDLNFSFISVVAYMSLFYLAIMFAVKSVIRRGISDEEEKRKFKGEDEEEMVREEEVKRMLRLVLPYLNESLFQVKALFSGDPSTTLKMGVVLFLLARCGSSITLWNLAKFGFLGVFTVPKLFTSYSASFSAYGKFWVRRFKDAWESCSHKKAVALGLFTVVWNLSSVTARVWAAFMLFVALRYYQQKMMLDTEWNNGHDQDNDNDDVNNEHVENEIPKVKRVSLGPSARYMMPRKLKKIS